MANRSVCKYCHNQLLSFAEQTDGVCSAPPCQGQHLHDQKCKARKMEEQARAQITSEAEAIAESVLGPLAPKLVIVVPALNSDEEAISDLRRLQFESGLREAITLAEQLAANPDKADCLNREYSFRSVTAASPTVVNACSTCRGRCCLNGREHAFLIPEFLAWRLLNEPGITPDTMVLQYMDLIPDQSVADSCVYHSRNGCVLPPKLRGSTCHDFFCTSLHDHPDVINSSAHIASACLAADTGRFFRIGYMTAEGTRTETAIPSVTSPGT